MCVCVDYSVRASYKVYEKVINNVLNDCVQFKLNAHGFLMHGSLLLLAFKISILFESLDKQTMYYGILSCYCLKMEVFCLS